MSTAAQLARRARKRQQSAPRWMRAFGPGLITGASDDDPSGIATYSQAGAQLGFSASWMMVLTYPLMAAVQEISARIGRTTGHGLAANIHRHYPGWVAQLVVGSLFIANTINIGADLGAMGAAVNLLVGGPTALYAIGFGVLCAALQIMMKYSRYVTVLKWLALSLVGYFATLATINVPWGSVLHGMLLPKVSLDVNFWSTLVAVFGTTISPYLFFWQASQEAEDVSATPERQPLVRKPQQGPDAMQRIRIDTYIGMAFSNLVALAIIISTASTLHVTGVRNVETAAQAAESLRPFAGPFAFELFALGILSTGLLSVPVLAGSAAYALAETRHWPMGLRRAPGKAKLFYASIALAVMLGAGLNLSGISPIRALYWSAVINGLAAAPVMFLMMRMSGDSKLMRQFAVTGPLRVVGWAATVVMAAAASVLAVTAAMGK